MMAAVLILLFLQVILSALTVVAVLAQRQEINIVNGHNEDDTTEILVLDSEDLEDTLPATYRIEKEEDDDLN